MLCRALKKLSNAVYPVGYLRVATTLSTQASTCKPNACVKTPVHGPGDSKIPPVHGYGISAPTVGGRISPLAVSPEEEDFAGFDVVSTSSGIYHRRAEYLAAELHPEDFGSMFQQCAPYIDMHREKIMVLHIPASVMTNPYKLNGLIDDIRCLHLLGTKLVLVPSVTEKGVESEQRQIKPFADTPYVNTMRVTDTATLNKIKEASGLARFDLESSFARAFRGQQAIRVVSGNFFYSARPVGVKDGVDFLHTGRIRKVDTANFHNCLNNRDIVLLSPIGHGPSGETFNVQSETVASAVAAELKAHKIIFLDEQARVLVDKHRCVVSHVRLAEAQKLLQQRYDSGSSVYNEFFTNIANCVHALYHGVNRAHIVSTEPGTLLQELYSRGGAGLLMTRDVYEGMRRAQTSDLSTVQNLIKPLVQDGILVPRSRAQLEENIEGMHLLARGDDILAVGILKEFTPTKAEIACLAAHTNMGRGGCGQTVFRFLERLAMKRGIKDLFVLSTQSMQWFEERGFAQCAPELLPAERGDYDFRRASKVYHKPLRSLQDVTAEEVLWHK